MKNSLRYMYMLLSFAAGSLVAVGCNQTTAEGQGNGTSVTAVSTTVAGDCCGKCARQATAASSAASTAKTDARCEGGFEGGCKPCAEGDSANCKCEAPPAVLSVETKSEQASEQADSHVKSRPEDRDIFHYLLKNHEQITRTVTELEDGVKTVTESTDAVIAVKIQEHVGSMYKRVEDGRPLRMWDELYREIFEHTDKIQMELEKTEHGISVTETSDDPYVVRLIQAHAKVVSGFVERGFEEARQHHPTPK